MNQSLAGCDTQHSSGNHQYPKTITKAINDLSNHKFYITRLVNKNVNKNSSKQTKQKSDCKKPTYFLLSWKFTIIAVTKQDTNNKITQHN